ncbi:SEC-C metal-binding domain-containing protein [Escherichia coli]
MVERLSETLWLCLCGSGRKYGR